MSRHARTRVTPGLRLWTLVVAVLVSGLTGASLAVPVSALAGTTARPGAAVPERVPLTLPTGESVTALVRDGALVGVGPAAGGDAVMGISAAGLSLVVPASAQPYLGWWLDPQLFDIRPQLEGRAPNLVRVEYDGASMPAVPGVTVRSAADGVATAAITDPAAFGRALLSHTRRTHGEVGRRPPVPGVTKVSAAADPAPATRAAPLAAQAQGTLDITVFDETGAPADPTSSVIVLNTDDGRLYNQGVRTSAGQAQIEVPEGHYTLLAAFATWAPTGDFANMTVLLEQDVEVTAAGAAVSLDAREATATPAATTPRPATLVESSFTWLTTDALTDPEAIRDGTPRIGVFGNAPAGQLRFTPAPPARFGHGILSLGIGLAGGTESRPEPYSYHLAHQTNGIPADLTKRVTAGELGTVASTFNGDGRRLVGSLTNAWQDEPYSGNWVTVPVTIPSRHTAYVSAQYAPGKTPTWLTYAEYPDVTGSRAAERFMERDYWSIAPGGRREQSWGGGPLSQFEVLEGDADFLPACARAWSDERRSMSLRLAGMRDAAGHDGSPWGDRGRAKLWRSDPAGEVQLIDGVGAGTYGVATVAAPSTYRLSTDITRVPTGARQSRFIRQEIVFRSGEGVDVPLDPDVAEQWNCPGGFAVTMLNARLRLPVDLNGQLPVGTTQLRLTVGHTPYGARHAITSATVQLRVAGGTWQDLALGAPAGGTYPARLNNPRAWAGKDVDVRFTATDAAGGRLTQEITAAYSVRG